MVAVPTEFFGLIIGYFFIFTNLIVKDTNIFKTMGAMIIMAFSIPIIANGVAGFSNLITQGIGFINVGVGSYFLLNDIFSKGKQKERFTDEEEEDDGRVHD